MNGRILKAIIEEKGKTMYWVAKQSGMTQSTLYSACDKECVPRLTTLKKVAEALGMPVSTLIKEMVERDDAL